MEGKQTHIDNGQEALQHQWTRTQTEINEMDNEIYKFLRTVPAGKVVTYGQIAEHFGNKNLARHIGNVLHKNPDSVKYPCYKVVNAKGFLSEHFAFGGMEGQRKRLEQDGISVDGNRVDLTKCQWEMDVFQS